MDHQRAAAQIVKECYTTGHFENLLSRITDDYEHHSIRVLEPLRGKDAVTPYYLGKGEAIRESGDKIYAMIVRIGETPKSVPVHELNVNGKVVHNTRLSVWGDFGKACVLLQQEIGGRTQFVLAIPTVNDEGMLTQLSMTDPSLFYLTPLEYEEHIGKIIKRKDGFEGIVKGVDNWFLIVQAAKGERAGKEIRIGILFLLSHPDVYSFS